MSNSIRVTMGLALLFSMLGGRAALCDEPEVKAVKIKRVRNRQNPVADAEPADALKPSKGDAKAEREKAAQDLEAVAAPLRILFGGRAARRMDIAVVDAQADDANIENDAMTQQFLQQYRPILKSELGFIRLVCSDLTVEQRPKIKAPAEAALKQAAKEMAKQQLQMQRGMGVRVNNAEPSQLIREAVDKALKETLNEEQLARYEKEATLRKALRKRIAILTLISRMDGQLYLTAEQRDKLTDALNSKWQDGWEKWTTMMNMYGDRYFPMNIDQFVTPNLTAEQKTVWQGLQKVDFGGWWGGGGNFQNQAIDGWWGDEPDKNGLQINGGLIINQVFGF